MNEVIEKWQWRWLILFIYFKMNSFGEHLHASAELEWIRRGLQKNQTLFSHLLASSKNHFHTFSFNYALLIYRKTSVLLTTHVGYAYVLNGCEYLLEFAGIKYMRKIPEYFQSHLIGINLCKCVIIISI